MSNDIDKESEANEIGYSSDSSDSFKLSPDDDSTRPPSLMGTTTTVTSPDPDLADLQRVDPFLQQLPYFETTKHYAFKSFAELKRNLAESIVRNEIRPGFTHWTNQLIVFIHEYGLFFTKSEHLQLIKLYLQVAQTPDIDLPTIDFCFSALFELLKKYDRITREDLVIDWRPIFKIYIRFHHINECTAELVPENIESNSFSNFMRYARIYFSENATREMLEEWRSLLCPFDTSMAVALERFKIFLPTLFYEHELESGYKLWLTEFINLWISLDNRQHWESYLLALLARVAVDNLGDIDWSPYIPHIFSYVLKGFGLPFGSKDSIALGVSTSIASFNTNMSQMFVYQSEDILNISSLIVSMIGSGRDGNNRDVCMEYIKKLFLALRSFFYPSNTGSWSSNLFLFLKCLPEAIIKRVKKEKREKSKWYHRVIKRENMISDKDITEFVEAMKGVVFTAIFSKSNHSDAKKAFQYLTFLRGEIMLPPLVDMIYESLESLTEPHRYTSILSVLVAVSRELATYNRFHKQTQTQMHVIQLMTAILPGLDPNDANKCLLTLHYLYNTISCIVLCDCQPATNYRNDLSEHERELCFETNKFEDFIHEFFKRVFYIVDILASDISADSSASAAAASNQFSITKSNNENIYQAQLIQTLRVLVRQSSKNILKIISNKLKNYINGNTFNTRAGRILANVIGYLCTVKSYGATAFETFFNYCYENLSKFRETKTFEGFKHNERGDIEVSWNLQLFSEILKAHGTVLIPFMPRINQVISWYRETIHKETISYISNSYRNIIHSLSTIYPIETASVSYDIVFEDEKEFFTKHLPIRDWACTTEVHNLEISYHKPTVKELETVIDFVESSLNESIGFFNRAVFSNEPSKKEERNRELNYVNHIVFGASRLLKRPQKNSFPNLIDSSVQIGIPDDANKGLGFETSLLNDPNHEYSKLSDRHKNIIMTLRGTLIEFLITLADKVNEKFANETPLLMLITRILCAASVTYGFFVNEFEKSWKSFYSNKSSLQNRLLGKKNSLRPELIFRIMLQYQYRTFYLHTRLNELDLKVIDVLFRLSTNSIYAVVRRDAQNQLFSFLAHYPYSSTVIVPGIVELLRGHNEETDDEAKSARHDQLKGCLYLLLGNSVQDSLMIKQNWSILSVLWPQVFKCQSFEKPSIQTLLEKIHSKTDKDFDSFDNRIRFGEALVQFAANMGGIEASGNRLERFDSRCKAESDMIEKLLDQLLKIAKQQSQLHWKNQANSFHAILYLLHNCVKNKSLLSVELVQLFVESLLSDNACVRKISIDGLCIILKMTKPKKITKRMSTIDLIKAKTSITDSKEIYVNRARPGLRPDNRWHLFDPNYVDVNTSETTVDEIKRWNESCFMDKNYWGYYCWPQEMEVPKSERNWYSSDGSGDTSYQAAMKPIIDRFMNDPEFVNKFIQLSIIEESKGDEKFDKKRFYFFKSLFRNFGRADIIHSLFENLEKLITDKDRNTHECSHKLAAEMLSGLIRGSKSWPLERLKPLWTRVRSILDKIVDNVSNENVKLWYNCFSNSFEDQDPRRLVFYLNYFTQLTLRMFAGGEKEATGGDSSATSFQQASSLQFLLALNQFEWKIPAFWNPLIDVFMMNMSHPYKSIREKNSSCLCLAHVTELDFSKFVMDDSTAELSPELIKQSSKTSLGKILKFIEERLRKDIELFDYINEDNIESSSGEKNAGDTKSVQHQSAVNFLQSVFAWFGYFILKSYQPINQQVLNLLPQLCSVDKIAAQEATVKTQLSMSRMAISMWIISDECSNILMGHLDKIIQYKSWHSRLAALQILQNFGIFNIFLVNDNIRTLVKKIVVSSLIDDQLEVRIAASLALTGFIHSHFVAVDKDLIDHLKTLSKTKPRKKDKESDKMVINLPGLVKRHGGILGLCSIVNSCPYDVPVYLPDVVTYLCQFTNDPVPIQGSVRKCLSEFRRTHHDNWQEHKQSFDESQLSILADILISPNYYA